MPLIDVHAHSVPKHYLTEMHKAGVYDCEGYPLPEWSEAEHLSVMDRNGITSSILSISAPGITFVKGKEARALARQINEEAAERRVRTKGRFGAFAILPLPDLDGALLEMEYALDKLKLDGIGLLTNYDGAYLGDPAFDRLFAEAEKRGAVVFVHPVAPVPYKQIVLGYSASVLEYPFETTRMLINMMSTGTFRNHPNLKLIATHGGGTMPFLAWRIVNIAQLFTKLTPPMTCDEAEDQFQKVFYDCTAVVNRVSLQGYKAYVRPTMRLYGSDTPFMKEPTIPDAFRMLHDDRYMATGERQLLESKNALQLFPELAKLLGL